MREHNQELTIIGSLGITFEDLLTIEDSSFIFRFLRKFAETDPGHVERNSLPNHTMCKIKN